jgi:hypothetical protein
MTIDPMRSLSFSMSASPGAYALLLGSGISRSAQIPTGWEITLELVRRIAAANGGEVPTNPYEWYQEVYGADPSYSDLLDQLAKSRPDRSGFLKPFFEPSEEERTENIKMPSRAHRAIANMVAQNHIRVIVTTNFDRLLEQALEDVSIRPVVISTEDQVQGAPPLVHAPCVILKVNGDYLDNRIRNTTQELETYEPAIGRLLDQILDEFGLIICGWSGDWDIAIRDAIMRCPSRRYMTYWASRGSLGQHANDVVTQRGATVLQIRDADSFFESIEEKIMALDVLKQPHPLSTASMVQTIKKYIVNDAYRIKLHDLLALETDKTLGSLAEDLGADFLGTQLDQSSLEGCLNRIDGNCSDLAAAFSIVGRWGNRAQIQLLSDSIVRVASFGARPLQGYSGNLSLRYIPALYLVYAGGMGFIKAGNYAAVEALVSPQIRLRVDLMAPIISANPHHEILKSNVLKILPGLNNKITPLSDYLHARLWRLLKPMAIDEEDYDRLFDQLELLLSMIYLRHRMDQGEAPRWTIPGRWVWKDRYGQGDGPADILLREISHEQEQWKPIQSGFLGGDIGRVNELVEPFNAFYQAVKRSR